MSTGTTLYQANLRTYSLLRYGAKVQVAAGAGARDGAPDRLG
jgi:type I restriction enzyme R subunit